MEFKRQLLAASLGISMGLAGFPIGSAVAQPTAEDIAGVMVICGPVISEQYEGNYDRRGFCVAAVRSMLEAIGAPSDAANPLIADLVAELVRLYQLPECPLYETELPEAIELAASNSTDPEQRANILLIASSITECEQIVTAAVGGVPGSPT